jgi:hypothetical protein
MPPTANRPSQGRHARGRIGLWKCKARECRKQFTVKVGTVFEHRRIPLHKMLQAVYLLRCSKKRGSSRQLHRILGITYKAAWFLSHRIREAMRDGSLAPMGGAGSIIEIDETAEGRIEGAPKRAYRRMGSYGRTVLTLVERGGSARSFHIEGTTLGQLLPIIRANVNRESGVMTDSASWYKYLQSHTGVASHETVNHTDYEYVRYPESGPAIHTNTRRRLLFDLQARDEGRLSALRREASAPLLGGINFRYNNRSSWDRRHRAGGRGVARRCRQADHIQSVSDYTKSSPLASAYPSRIPSPAPVIVTAALPGIGGASLSFP